MSPLPASVPFAAWAAALAAALLLAIGGCHAPPVARSVPQGRRPPADAVHYRIDAQASSIRLYLHADGRLARLGHTHVIVAHDLQGDVWLAPHPEQSLLDVRLPVAALVVDDPDERRAAGAEFAEPLDDDARSGTRTHMLGEQQLAAAAYPSIALRSRALHVQGDALLLDLEVTVRDHSAVLAVPLQWRLEGDRLQASGDIRFLQSTLGIEPYSALLGALRVADEVRARFEFTARR